MIKQRREPGDASHRRNEIAAALEERISEGEFVPGALVPSGRELAAEYGCAPMTAQAALQILARKGVIRTIPRQGSVVTVADRSIGSARDRGNRSLQGGLFRRGETALVTSARLAEDAHPDARAALGVLEGESVGMREYTVTDSRGVVVTAGISYVHPEVWHAVPELREPAPIPDGIIGAIRRVLHREGRPTPPRFMAAGANEDDAAALGIEQDAPVIVEVTECRDERGQVVEWNISVHPERYWIGG